MDYFENLPKINITYGNTTNLIRNLFFKITIGTTINEEFLIVYKINDGQTLEDIAEEVYGDSALWWVIAIINNIQDVYYDLPLDPNSVQTIANAKAKTVTGKITTGGTTSIIDNSLVELYGDDYFNGATFQHLTGTNATQELTITDYNGQTGTFTFASSSQININDTYIIEDAPLDLTLFSEYYDLLETYNEARRDIVVLRADYIAQFLSDVTKEVSDNS
jgi:hypothetical protein